MYQAIEHAFRPTCGDPNACVHKPHFLDILSEGRIPPTFDAIHGSSFTDIVSNRRDRTDSLRRLVIFSSPSGYCREGEGGVAKKAFEIIIQTNNMWVAKQK